jgi:hypothetical protein
MVLSMSRDFTGEAVLDWPDTHAADAGGTASLSGRGAGQEAPVVLAGFFRA